MPLLFSFVAFHIHNSTCLLSFFSLFSFHGLLLILSLFFLLVMYGSDSLSMALIFCPCLVHHYLRPLLCFLFYMCFSFYRRCFICFFIFPVFHLFSVPSSSSMYFPVISSYFLLILLLSFLFWRIPSASCQVTGPPPVVVFGFVDGLCLSVLGLGLGLGLMVLMMKGNGMCKSHS